MRKVLIVAIVVVFILLVVISVKKFTVSEIENSTNYDLSLLNNNGQFELEAGSYIIGEDIPHGNYEVENAEGKVKVQVIYEDDSEFVLLEQGDELDLINAIAITITEENFLIKLK